MSAPHHTEFTGVKGWIDYRLPIFTFLKHQSEYRAPRNLNYAWNFGSILGVALVIQIVTGIFLAMNYQPHVGHAFDSVERIMRDVPFGWLLRYVHAVGASMFFAACYLHIARSLYYGSYKPPRELLWWFGVIIFLVMMATAFMGYVLPWGQMSFWGATVITNLFSAFDAVIDGLGTAIVQFLLGGFSVDNPTINRFFTLHYLLPFVLFGLVFFHLWALHHHGSNNPTGVDVKNERKDTVPFHPYYTVKDYFGFGVFFLIFFWFVFFEPNRLGHPDNYIPANPLVTPAHIVPEWYFLPFYAMLRAITFDIGIPWYNAVQGWHYAVVLIPAKLGGVLVMFGSILVWFFMPWLDTHPVRSGKYRPIFKIFFWLLMVDFVILGYLGGKPAEGVYVTAALCCAIYYMSYFLIVMPVLSRKEKARNVPESIYHSVKTGDTHQP